MKRIFSQTKDSGLKWRPYRRKHLLLLFAVSRGIRTHVRLWMKAEEWKKQNTWEGFVEELKFSATRKRQKLTIPAKGRGGNWIVKLPDQRFPNVPENEWSIMAWAKESGLTLPTIDLVPLCEIEGIPPSFHASKEGRAFVIERFDRTEKDRRIHIEDFAQIFDLYPQEKYKKYTMPITKTGRSSTPMA